MSQDINDFNELVIKIPESIWNKSGITPSAQRINFDILNQIGVQRVSGKQNSEHGESEIQTLIIPQDNQRYKVLQLFINPILYSCIPKIYQYIYDLGLCSDGEKRHFASIAISELASYSPFLDLKEHVIIKWAKAEETTNGRESAALALVSMIQNNRHKDEIINLLRHWSRNSNLKLVATALIVYQGIYQIYPTEGLEAIKNVILLKNTFFLIPRTFALIEHIYNHHPSIVVETLYTWFTNESDELIHIFASVSFLTVADVSNFTENEIERLHAVEFTYALWEHGPRKENLRIQELTTTAVYAWAKKILQMADNTEKAQCQKFFHELDQKYLEMKRNRLRFHLKRWESRSVTKQSSSTRKNVEAKITSHLDFFSLIESQDGIK